MKRKLLTIIAIIAVIFVSTVLWRVNGFVFGDRMNWAEAQARSQMVSMHHAILVELKSLERMVYSFNSENFRKDKINWNSLQPYYAVASLGVGSQGDLLTQNLFVKTSSPAAGWSADFLNKALGRMDLKPSPQTQIFVKPFQDANKGRHVALVFVNRSRAYALIGSGELFQSLIDAQKGSLNSFSVVSTSGWTVGHSIPEYVGTLLGEDPVFKAAQQGGVAQGLGVFDAGDGQKVFGLYDQIPDTNLWIISSAPMKDLMKGRAALLWQFLLLGVGLVLVGVGGVLLVIRPHEKSLELLKEHARDLVVGKKEFSERSLVAEVREIDELLTAIPTGAPVPAVKEHVVAATPPPVTENSLDTEKVQREQTMAKMEAYRRVASALGHEMRAPLTSILGYSQMILARTQDGEIVSSVDSILRESRSARGVLEKLFSFAGEEDFEKNEMKVEGPLVRALKNLDGLFSAKGVVVRRDFAPTEALPVSIDELTRALENILTNSVEAMERMPKKDLEVKLHEDAEGVHIEINDSGEGIEASDLDKIFDPFFTTRSFQNHTGLGLAVTLGILKEHNADVKVKSERGVGTQIQILFRKAVPVEAPKAPVAERVLVEVLPLMREEPEKPVPAPLPAPAAAVEEARVAAREEERNPAPNEKADMKPTDVNIDNLLELPPETPAFDEELQLMDEKPTLPKPAVPAAKEPPPPVADLLLEDTQVDLPLAAVTDAAASTESSDLSLLEEEEPVKMVPLIKKSEPAPATVTASTTAGGPLTSAPSAPSAPAASPAPSTAVTPSAAKAEPVAAKKWMNSSQDEELSFIDGFMDDAKPAAPPPSAKEEMSIPPPPPEKIEMVAPVAPEEIALSSEVSVPAEAAVPIAAAPVPPPPPPVGVPPEIKEDLNTAPVDADIPKPTITAPRTPPPAKKSKLDSFQVNISRPGKGS